MAPVKRSWNPLTLILALSVMFFLFFLASSAFLFVSRGKSAGGMATGSSRAKIFAKGAVGVIELNGVILDSKRMLRQLREFREDDSIKAIVIRLNSPGGAVAPSQEIYTEVKAFPKPVVATMGSVAASGAYYIAMGAGHVFANPGTITGSIGVIMEFANLERLYDWAKVKRYTIKTGAYKDSGADYREMRPDERALIQGMVDDVLSQFKQAVQAGRKLSPEAVTRVADGRIFSGAQALQLKLVDELGGIQEAIKKAAELAKLEGEPEVVYPDRPRRSFIEQLMRESDPEEASSQSALVGAAPAGHETLVSILKRTLGLSEGAAVALPPGVYWIWPGAR